MLGGLNSNSPTFLITDCINYFRLELGLELACLDFLWKKKIIQDFLSILSSPQDVEKKAMTSRSRTFLGVILKKSTYTLYTAFWFSSVLCHESLLQTIASLRAFSPLLNQEGEKNEGKRLQVGTSRHNARRRQKCRRSWNCDATDVPFGPKGVQIGLADTRGTSIVVLLSIPQR